MASKSALLLSLSILLYLSVIAHSDDADCVYTMYIKTGGTDEAGTDSMISLRLYTEAGDGVLFKNLEKWGGLMGRNYDYFKKGNLDIFSGTGPCLSRPVCSLNLTSDGTGWKPDWYCNFIEVTTTSTGNNKTCEQALFMVNQWLDFDSSPFKLTAVVDNCPIGTGSRRDLSRSGTPTASLDTVI